MDLFRLVVVLTSAVVQVTGKTLKRLNKSPVYHQERSGLELKCVFRSVSPNGVFKWFKDRAQVKEPEFLVLNHVGYEILDNGQMILVTTSTLTRKGTAKSDSGQYACNIEGLERTTEVKVVTFQETPEIVINPGNPITVRCNVGSIATKVKTKWKKDDVSLSSVTELLSRVEFKDHNTTLEINNSSYMDSGKYQCNMTVLEGEQQGNITHEILISGIPYFPDGDNQTELHHGKAGLQLRCLPSGYPSPNISWKKDSEDLVIHDEITVLPYEDLKQAIIKFTQFGVSDVGLYSCDAKNRHGSSIRNFQILNVSGAQSLFTRTQFVPLFLCLLTLICDFHL